MANSIPVILPSKTASKKDWFFTFGRSFALVSSSNNRASEKDNYCLSKAMVQLGNKYK